MSTLSIDSVEMKLVYWRSNKNTLCGNKPQINDISVSTEYEMVHKRLMLNISLDGYMVANRLIEQLTD
ncbi:hypothetical protein BLOT_004959 [Blomia tropicalis]|nr:hypothetical protein BLOT_004959 [Blomia tropicalis]